MWKINITVPLVEKHWNLHIQRIQSALICHSAEWANNMFCVASSRKYKIFFPHNLFDKILHIWNGQPFGGNALRLTNWEWMGISLAPIVLLQKRNKTDSFTVVQFEVIVYVTI